MLTSVIALDFEATKNRYMWVFLAIEFDWSSLLMANAFLDRQVVTENSLSLLRCFVSKFRFLSSYKHRLPA